MRRRFEEGFTLIELLVVIAIIAIGLRIAVLNMGALVPSSILNSECRKFMSHIDFLRSEAQLQGRTYVMELDLDNSRWRVLLPPEDRLVSDMPEQKEMLPLDWLRMHDDAKVAAHAVAGGDIVRRGLVQIKFDENGFTADQSVIFRLRDQESQLVWSINIRGLTGRSTLSTDIYGKPKFLQKTEEYAFN